LTRYVIMKLSAIVCNFRLDSASAITYPLNKWRRAGKSNKRKEEKMDTSIDKPIKRPVPKPITGQFPKRGANGQFLRGASGNPQGRPLGSRNRASLLMEDLLDGRAKALTEKAETSALAELLESARRALETTDLARRAASVSMVFRSAAGAGAGLVVFLQKGNAKDRGTPSGGKRQGRTALLHALRNVGCSWPRLC